MVAVIKMISAAMMTGIMIAKMENSVATISSRILTGTLPVPAVVAVIVGRTAIDFIICTLPATNRPVAIIKMGVTSTEFVLAAKTIAPAAGRMKLWMMSLI